MPRIDDEGHVQVMGARLSRRRTPAAASRAGEIAM